jgi:phosphatidylethanolamine-binding protein (PEBP) family uncharacterized protein
MTVIAALALAAAGCGSSNNPKPSATATANGTTQTSPTTTPTPTTTQAATTTTPTRPATTSSTPPAKRHVLIVKGVELTSPAFTPGGAIPARYTCNGQNTSPPLHIAHIPPGTHELMLLILNTTPVNNKLYYDWAITHINPHTTTINPGETPPNAITGNNTQGQNKYNLHCPPNGQTETYLTIHYALPHPLHTKPHFNATTERKNAQQDAEYSAHLYYTYTPH